MRRRLRQLWNLAILLAGAGFAASCSTPEEEMSASEWIEANTTVFNKVGSFDEEEQREGIERLKRLGQEQGSGVVFWVLNDPKLENPRLEVMLARLLADWKDPRAIPFLLRSLADTDDGAVRLASEGLLVFQDNPRVTHALYEMLNQGDVNLRERQIAAGILSRIRTRETTQMLGERILLELDPEVRAQCVIGVIQGRHPKRAAYLVDALTSQDEATRDLAWNALRKYKDLPDVKFSASDPDAERARDVGALRMWAARRKGRS